MAGVELATAYLSLIPSLQGATGDAQKAGEEAGGVFSGGFGKVLKGGALVASVAALGSAAGAAFSSTFGAAMERETATAKASASLGLDPAQSKELGATAGRLYSQAYGESIGDVASTLTAVQSSLKGLDGAGLEGATKKAMSFASAFDVDVTRSVASVSTLMGSGLVKSSDEAFDLITRASQKVPAALREDVLDASDEYGQFFNALGFDGAQAFGALTKASDKGVFGIDKTGDAIKEFTIRATDMSATSTAAYQSIGLDAGQMANAILAGGDQAQSATQKIVAGLQGITDPATQANTAIALFGTPIEDLGVQNIPAFLESLSGATGGLGDFAGAAAEVDAKLGATMESRFTAATRSVAGLGTSLAVAVLPLLGPVLDGVTSLATAGGEKLVAFGDAFQAVIDVSGSGEGYDAIGGRDSFLGGLANGLYGAREQLDEFQSDVSAAFATLRSGDFDPSQWGHEVSEDSPVVRSLLFVQQSAQDVGAAVRTVVSGDFDPAQWGHGISEDSPIVGGLLRVRETALEVGDRLGGVFDRVVAVAGPMLAELWEQVAPILGEVWDSLKGTFSQLLPIFKQVFTALQPVFDQILPLLPQLLMLMNPFSLIFHSLLPVLPQIADLVGSIAVALAGALAQAFKAIVPLVVSLMDAVLGLVPVFMDLIADLIPPLMGLLSSLVPVVVGLVGAIVPLVAQLLTQLVPVILDLASALVPLIAELLPVIIDLFSAVVPVLASVIGAVLPVVGVLLDALLPAIRELLPVVLTVFEAASDIIKGTASVITWLLSNVVVPIFDGIGKVMSWWFSNVVSPVFGFVVGVLHNAGDVFGWLWNNVVTPVFAGIGTAISAAWSGVIKPVFGWLSDGLHAAGDVFTWLWHNIVEPVFTGIGTAIDWAWDNVISPAFELIKSGLTGVGDFFSTVGEGIRDAWSKIKSWVAAPINWVIEHVWNDGIVALWNKITGWIPGVDISLGTLEPVAMANGGLVDRARTDGMQAMATGGFFSGIVPGYAPGRDNHNARLSGGEGVLIPEAVRGLGPDFVLGANRHFGGARLAAHSAGGPSFGADGQAGFFLGGLWDGIKSVAGGIKDFVVDVAGGIADAATFTGGFISDPLATMMSMLGPDVAAGLEETGKSPWGKAIAQLPGSIVGGLISGVKSALGLEDDGTGAAPVIAVPSEAFNSSQDPSSFGWQVASDITPFSFKGFPFPAGVASKAKDAFTGLLTELVPQIPGGLISGTNWGFENRDNVNSPGRKSFHSYGLALDVNSTANPNGASGTGRSGPGVIPAGPARSLASKYGMEWGGDFRGTPDPMHFEYHLSPAGMAATAAVAGSALAGSTRLMNTNSRDQWASPGTSAMVGPLPPGSAVDRWRPTYLQALAMTGQPASAVGGMLNQMRTESGGNPLAINLYDRNAKAGYPSKGLLQTIGPTFASYGMPGYNTNIWDPLSNALASIRYVLDEYGSLSSGYRGVAYDEGGVVPVGETMVHNHLETPEALLTTSQWSTAAKAISYAVSGNGIDQPMVLHVDRIELGGETVAERVRVALDAEYADAEFQMAAMAGRA